MGDPVKRLHGVAKLTCSHSTLIVAIQQAKTEFLDAEKFAQLSIIVLEVRLYIVSRNSKIGLFYDKT